MKRALLLVLVSCGGTDGTAVRVRVDFDEAALKMNLLRFEGLTGMQTVFGPELRGDPDAGEIISSGGDLLVLLPDTLAGKTLRCEVTGAMGGAEVAGGAGTVMVVKDHEVECQAVLTRKSPPMMMPPMPMDAGARDAGSPPCKGCWVFGRCEEGTKDFACGMGGAVCRVCKCKGGRCD